MIFNLVKGQTISVVTIAGIELVCNALTMGTAPFTTIDNRSEQLAQRFDVFELTESTEIKTEDSPAILDADGNAYYKLTERLKNTIILK